MFSILFYDKKKNRKITSVENKTIFKIKQSEVLLKTIFQYIDKHFKMMLYEIHIIILNTTLMKVVINTSIGLL